MNNNSQEVASVRIARNSIYLITAQIIGRILTFFYYLIIARYLGAVGIGKYSFILSLVGMFIIFSNFGFDTLMVRDIAISKKQVASYLSNVCIIKFCLATFSTLVLLIIINVMDKTVDVKLGIVIICLNIFFEGVSNSTESVFNAYEKLKFIAFIDIIINTLKVLIAVLVKLQSLTLLHLLTGIVLLSFMRATLGWVILNKIFFRFKFVVNFQLIKTLLKNAYPFAFMGFIFVLYYRIDSVILSLMKDDAAVGWYAASFNFVSMLMFLSYAFCRAIFPVMSKYYNSSKEKFLRLGEKSFNFLLMIGLPIALGITLLADKIILLIYGDQFSNSIWAIRILIWSIPLIYVNSPLLRMLYSANKQNIAAAIISVGLFVNIILNFLLIPKYSYLGASLSTVFSEFINLVLYYFAIFKLFSYKLKLNKATIRSLGALCIMAIFILFSRSLNLFFVIPMSGLIYSFMLYFTKAFSRFEINVIKSAIQGKESVF